ncbi:MULTISPECIES: hypothetical protein [unclassified Priestia]|uniref:hypothetical protein n=1 Tax=unclassified Priestia TaxID=2800374 RepID=UPI000D513E16|nr:hypothetical protein DC428_16110 [Priestia megaterium]PVE83404.1 hypothetical protein DC426_21615 [Priestia megaterium]PVE88614.1 hypothetical protein DC421_00710 [Priestia megaterium]PVF01951.1 hypothetical protein DC433_02365 [Priestia megaterium]
MKEDPNNQSKFLTENSTRSDFFIVMVNVDLPYVIAVNWRARAEQVRPRRSVSDEESHRPPAESEVLRGN